MSKYKFGIMHLPIQRYLKWWLEKYAQSKEVDYNKTFYLGKTEQYSTTGKQLFDYIRTKTSSGYVMLDDNKGIQVDFTTSSDRYFILNPILGTPTTKAYTLSFEASGLNTHPIRFTLAQNGQFYSLKNGKNICVIPEGTNLQNGTIIWDDEYTASTKDSIVTFTKFMLVEGEYTEETMPEYEEYTGRLPSPSPSYPQPIINLEGNLHFRKNNKDYYFTLEEGQKLMQDGKIEDKVINEWREYVLDGTENWITATLANGRYVHYINDLTNINHSTTAINIKSNIAKGILIGDRFSADNNYTVYTINGGFSFRYDSITNVDDWKSYLAEQYANGTPVKVQYKSLNPISINFTQTQLAQYKKLCEAFPNGTNLNDYLV